MDGGLIEEDRPDEDDFYPYDPSVQPQPQGPEGHLTSPNEPIIPEVNVTVNSGADALLDCHVIHEQSEATTTVQVAWSRDGQQIGSLVESSRFDILSNGSLVLKRVDFNDHGTYACVTSGLAGAAEETGYVKLLVKGMYLF